MKTGIRLLLTLILLAGSLRPVAGEDVQEHALVSLLQQRALPLATEADLAPLLKRTRKTRLVLLGDASHGSYDFYRVRTHITQRLLLDQGFSFIAIEGDWEGAAAVDRYVRNLPGTVKTAAEALQHLNIWPGWVWNNREMERLIEWLRRFNLQRRPEQRVPIYGMDLLGFSGSLEKLCDRPETATAGNRLKDCLAPYRDDPVDYPRALFDQEGESCAAAVAALRSAWMETGNRTPLAIEQQLRIVENAEAYYRAMATSDAEAWNRRAAHFADTLERLLSHQGTQTKGIVWAHNTHIGDARLTAMADHGWQSLGQLLRRRLSPESLLLVGSTTYRGTVLSSRGWGAPVEQFPVPPAAPGSFEELMHRTGLPIAYWLFDPADQNAGPLSIPRGQRAVGVVYEPRFDARDNYLNSLLPARYDALIFVDTTTALEPLGE
jgi:erythromycin esterase-like protein